MTNRAVWVVRNEIGRQAPRSYPMLANDSGKAHCQLVTAYSAKSPIPERITASLGL